MDELQQQVLILIRHGRDNAIKGSSLARACGLKNDRAVRLAIRELIQAGEPIASAVTPPYGFYLAETPGECEEYIRVERERIIENARRLRDFKVATKLIRNPEQMVLL